MATEAEPEYLYHDRTLYRTGPDMGIEAFIDGTWGAVVPSESDYDHMRAVTLRQAIELVPTAFE